MKRFFSALSLIVVASLIACTDNNMPKEAVGVSTPGPAELEANFRNPPDEAKPRTWFHAMSGNMSKDGLTKDLESLAEVGIGGLLLFNVSQGIPVGDVPYNSDRHHEMLTHAAAESERLGLSFGVHNCDGWSSSGGPWVKPEESMKMVVYSSQVVKQSERQTVRESGIVLTQPTTREGYYEDIAVVAYPSLYTEVEDSEKWAIVTASDPNYDTQLVTDGKIDAEVRLGKKKGPAPWLQFEYERPAIIRSASATFTDRNATVLLQSSEDGRNWVDVRELYKVRTGKGEWAVNDHFEPVTARYFRMQFNQDVGLREAQLYRTYLLENPLGQTAMARTEDSKFRDIGTPPRNMTIDPETVINLTEYMDTTGRLVYDFPEGDWTVMRFGQTSTGAFNNPASWEGRGLEVDKMSRPAFKTHYDAFIRRVVDEAGAAGPNALQYVEIDSYEAGGQNWTTGFNDLFKERKGYDFIPFLPLVAGRFMGAAAGAVEVEGQGTSEASKDVSPLPRRGARGEVSEAVLYDFREVITDLVTENYFGYFTELCHADGLKTYVEPYGFGPLNDLDVGGTADIPMGEFWMNREITQVESAVSAAHIYGKPVVSAESFTSTPQINWRGNPAMAKLSGDKAWAMGINEFMFHRFAHQANPNVTPGMTMNRWGFHFDRTQTWWNNAGKDWFRYIARGSYLLRQGHPVADLMIFVGDGKPNSRFKWEDFDPAIPKWLNYDNVNADVLINRIGLTDGQLVLPEGGQYPLLALKNCDHLSLPTLRRLVEIAESGVTVVGKAPGRLAGYGHSEADYETFAELAERLAVYLQPANDWQSRLGEHDLTPDLTAADNDTLIYEHRRVGTTDVYFMVNESSAPDTLLLNVRVRGKQPERWNPLTGTISPIRRYAPTATGTRLQLALEGEESVFLVFRDDVEMTAPIAASNWKEPDLRILGYRPISEPWTVSFREADGFVGPAGFTEVNGLDALPKNNDPAGITTLPFQALTDWTDHPDERVRYYSGTATYRTEFDFRPTSNATYHLDLGEVNIIAAVKLNGKDLGVQWMKPLRVDITDAVREGTNVLEIAVTNLWSNRLIGEERYPKQDGGYKLERYRNGNGVKLKMPAWYVNNEPVPPGPRTTFTTSDFYDADDALFPSGLKGPVKIIALEELVFAPAAAPEKDD
jgi:hypothetical protein